MRSGFANQNELLFKSMFKTRTGIYSDFFIGSGVGGSPRQLITGGAVYLINAWHFLSMSLLVLFLSSQGKAKTIDITYIFPQLSCQLLFRQNFDEPFCFVLVQFDKML